MLIMNHTCILNCLDFYENFNASDAVEQPEALVDFAKCHLDFNSMNHHCIRIMMNALDNSEPLQISSDADFWREAPEVPSRWRNVVTEAFIFCKKKFSAAEDWEKKFLIAAAATLLAGKHSFALPETIKSADGASQIDLTDDIISILPGYTYDCRFLSPDDLNPDESFNIRTVTVHIKADYSGEAIIRFNNGRVITCPSGCTVYFNVCKNAVASILPNEVSCSQGVLQRDCKQKCITYNGKKTGIPFEASSFAVFGESRYLYILDHKILSIGLDHHMLPSGLTGKHANWAEVRSVGNQYYLLSCQGIVKNNQGITPKDMQHHFLCLDDVLGGC